VNSEHLPLLTVVQQWKLTVTKGIDNPLCTRINRSIVGKLKMRALDVPASKM
jgi:hypothetical protein